MRRLILIDIDGTLLNDDGLITSKTRNAINEVINSGDVVMIASGRPRGSVAKIGRLIGCNYIISSNGAEIYDIGLDNCLFYLAIDDLVSNDLIRYASSHGILMKISSFGEEFVTASYLNVSAVKQIMFIHDDYKVMNDLRSYIISNTDLKIVDETNGYGPKSFTVNRQGCSKASALIFMSNYFGISLDKAVVIGNDYNDIPMFKVCPNSYAMANSNEVVKLHARYITLSNNDDGVYLALKK